MIRKRKSQMRSILIWILLLLTFAAGFAHAAEPRTLRVAFYPLDGFFEYDANGKETGYGVELLEAVSEQTGLRFTYVPAETWGDTQKLLLSGEADIRMPGSMPIKPSATLGYTSESIMDTCRAMMTLSSRDDLYYRDYERFGTLRIAMTQSLFNSSDVRDYLDGIGVSQANIVFCDEYSLCRQALDNGEVDAVISNIMDMTDDLKLLARFSSVSNHITMTLGNPDLKLMDDALAEIKMNDPSFLPLLYQAYYPERNVTPYTRAEVEYIQGAGTVIVGQLAERTPLSYLDEETGRITGMFVDLCDLIAKKSGLRFRYEMVPASMRAVDWLRSTDAKLVSGVMFSEMSSPSAELAHSDTAFPNSVVVVGRAGERFDRDSEMDFAMPLGFIGGEAYLKTMYPNAHARFYESNEECLHAIVSGEADVLLQNLYVIRAALQSPRFDTLEILPVYEVEESMKLVMLNTENPLLMSVVNKAIGAITDDELNDIIVTHTIAKPYRITLGDTLYKYRTPFKFICALAAISTALFVVIIVTRQRNMRRIQFKNAQLAEAYEQARVASQAKGDFLARMSHEIRTPMNAIIGITTLAMDHVKEPELVKDDLNKVATSSRVLLSILNDVLDMSAIESGKLKIAHAPFDFKQLISSLTTVYYAQCQAKGVAFQTKLSGSVEEWLVGDQLRVNQILMNLLSNACKFTERGCVSLRVEQRAVQQGKTFIRFIVSDTGSGIEPEMLARLWKPFEQENAQTAQEHGGSGLGLSIVKSLVSMMNGAISVESRKGEGTTFTVDLPFESCEQKASNPGNAFKRLRVLVVDDAPDMQEYVSAVLERIGVRHASAASCDEALQMLAEAKAEHDPYNACIVEWRMPGMIGAEDTKRIRAVYGCEELVIIASAYDHAEVNDAAREAGADRFVDKPLFQSTMFDLLMSLSQGTLVKGGAVAKRYDFTGRRVLLAEDNDMNRLVGVGLLKKVNVVCETAVNGQLALDMFIASPPGYYDAILMDVQMPVMDGCEATKAIRASAHPCAKTVPILAMTANAFVEDVAICLQCGMDDHVAKPIEMEALLSALNRAFQKKEG